MKEKTQPFWQECRIEQTSFSRNKVGAFRDGIIVQLPAEEIRDLALCSA